MFNLVALETMLEEYFELKVEIAMNGREAVE
jgi:hypothetical protein